MMSFLGFARPDGSVGVRNYIGVVSTVACANDVAHWISQRIEGTGGFRIGATHTHAGSVTEKRAVKNHKLA